MWYEGMLVHYVKVTWSKLRIVPECPNGTPTPPSSSGEGAMNKRGAKWSKQARQPEPPQNKIIPTPNEFGSQPHEPPTPNEPQYEYPHWATPNQGTDIEHMPPNPNAMKPGTLRKSLTDNKCPQVSQWDFCFLLSALIMYAKQELH
ncbi:hypothetical protein AMECASPLE_026035 [Ameca splendens]|uniref:Uncharacterized protein n=1 Tax=Ameca splendens TaxID=208324 RepID=A0ABV1ACJ4_9TELE